MRAALIASAGGVGPDHGGVSAAARQDGAQGQGGGEGRKVMRGIRRSAESAGRETVRPKPIGRTPFFRPATGRVYGRVRSGCRRRTGGTQ